MKPRSPLQSVLLSSSLLVLTAHVAHAADLFWDGTSIDGDANGGDGTWQNGTTTNWDTLATGGTDTVWTNANNDSAIFGGTAGTVTLGSDVTIGGNLIAAFNNFNTGKGINFGTAGYTINGGGNAITLGSDITVTGDGTINANINTNGFKLTTLGSQTYGGVISGSGDFIPINVGSATVTLSGPNTYTGKTSMDRTNSGSLTLSVSSFNSIVFDGGGAAIGALMPSSSLGAPTTVANGTIGLGAGIQKNFGIVYTGDGETTNRVINITFNGSSDRQINNSGSGLLRFTSNFTGSGNASSTFTLSGDGDGQIDGNITQQFKGINKNGAGTWTLGGTIGNTTVHNVNEGTLIINGLLTATTVTVDSGATLGGSGTVGGAISISNGGTLSPGNSAGQFTVGGTLTLAGADTKTIMELGGTTLGTTYDNISLDALATAMTYGGDLSVVNLGLYNMDASSFTYDLFDLKSVTATGDFDTVTVNSIALINTLGVWTGSNGGVSYSFSQATGDLNIAVVPEPATALLGAIGILALLRRRR